MDIGQFFRRIFWYRPTLFTLWKGTEACGSTF